MDAAKGVDSEAPAALNEDCDVGFEYYCPHCKGDPRILIVDGTCRGVEQGKCCVNMTLLF